MAIVANLIIYGCLAGVGLAMLWALLDIAPEDPQLKAQRQADEDDWWDYQEGLLP